MTTNNAEALRALEQLRAGGEGEDWMTDAERSALDFAITALASQPQAAGVGGDAVRQMIADSKFEGWWAREFPETEARCKADDLVALGNKYSARQGWNAALASTPAPAVSELRRHGGIEDRSHLIEFNDGLDAPAVEREADECGDCGGLRRADAILRHCICTTPPAEAREPEPRGSKPTRAGYYTDHEQVSERGHANCPTCHTPCRTEKVLWSERFLGTQSRIDYLPLAAHQAQGAAVDAARSGEGAHG